MSHLDDAIGRGAITGELRLSDVGGEKIVDETISLREDMANIFVDAMKLFSAKSQDYTNSNGAVFEDSGLMGQHLKLTDKVKKLRKTMWDAEIIREARNLGITADNGDLQQLRFEDTEEILMDVIGHCALAISILRGREEERKRDNENIRERLSGSLSDTPVGQVGLF